MKSVYGSPNKMNASIRPLNGKYYGTLIDIDDGTWGGSTLEVWIMGNYRPSKRQLEHWEVESYEGAKEDGFLSDDHFESELGYIIAEAIVKTLQGLSGDAYLSKEKE